MLKVKTERAIGGSRFPEKVSRSCLSQQKGATQRPWGNRISRRGNCMWCWSRVGSLESEDGEWDLGEEIVGKSGKKWDWSIDRGSSKDSKPGFLFSLCNMMRMIQTLLQRSRFQGGTGGDSLFTYWFLCEFVLRRIHCLRGKNVKMTVLDGC